MKAFAPQLSPASAVKPGTVQRKCGCSNPGKCDCAKEKEPSNAIQRRATPSAKAVPQSAVSAPVASGIQSASQGAGHSLPAAVRGPMESGFGGHDLSSVRVHNDGHAHHLADSLQAHHSRLAIHLFAANQYQPQSKEGQRLLAHELTHVVQQSSSGHGAVQARLNRGTSTQPAEREADRVADAIVSGISASPATPVASSMVQRAPRAPRAPRTSGNPTLAGVPPGTPVSQALREQR